MVQNLSKTRLRMGLSNPPKKASTRHAAPPVPGGDIQSILFAGFDGGSRPPAGHADDQGDHADTGQHQKERKRGGSDRGGPVLPD
jgi:hypothetical protein